MKKNKKYTPEENQFLRENYPTKGSLFCSLQLNRSKSQIIVKAFALGVKFLRRKIARLGYKWCKICNEEKETNQFNKYRGSSDHLVSYCRTCQNKRQLERREANREKEDEYQRNYRLKNAEKRRAYSRQYSKNHKKQININRENRYKNDLLFNIKEKIRSNIKASVKYWKDGTHKAYRTIKLLGCSFPIFQSHFIKKFSTKMTWELFMRGKIHIDHIIPVDFFNLLDPEEQLVCFHYLNTQPLWMTNKVAISCGDLGSIGNSEKGNKFLINGELIIPNQQMIDAAKQELRDKIAKLEKK